MAIDNGDKPLRIDSTVTLTSGYEMPLFGLGVFKMDDHAECVKAVTAALDMGYRHIDTARAYENEDAVGEAVANASVERSAVFITSKVMPWDYGRDTVRRAVEDSLRKLRTDYIDLYLLHWPIREKMAESWKVLQAMRDEGLLRSIGVSNVTVRRFDEQFFRHTDEAPAVNQIECHPFNAQEKLIAYGREKGIHPVAYSPLARARRMDEPVLREAAEAHGKSVAQVMIRWQLQRGVGVIPKSSHIARIRENADVFDFSLTSDDMRRLSGLDEGYNTISWRPEENWF